MYGIHHPPVCSNTMSLASPLYPHPVRDTCLPVFQRRPGCVLCCQDRIHAWKDESYTFRRLLSPHGQPTRGVGRLSFLFPSHRSQHTETPYMLGCPPPTASPSSESSLVCCRPSPCFTGKGGEPFRLRCPLPRCSVLCTWTLYVAHLASLVDRPPRWMCRTGRG